MELLIVVAIILIIGAIAIPKLNTARMQAQEMAAISQIRTIHQGQTMYFSQFGKYAQTLQELGPPASGQPGPNGADLVPGDLAAGLKSGYNFQMLPAPPVIWCRLTRSHTSALAAGRSTRITP